MYSYLVYVFQPNRIGYIANTLFFDYRPCYRFHLSIIDIASILRYVYRYRIDLIYRISTPYGPCGAICPPSRYQLTTFEIQQYDILLIFYTEYVQVRTKMTLVVIARAEGIRYRTTDRPRKKIEIYILKATKLWVVTQKAVQNLAQHQLKINHRSSTKTMIISRLYEVATAVQWGGEAPSVNSFLSVAFTEQMVFCCDAPDSVFGLFLRPFSLHFYQRKTAPPGQCHQERSKSVSRNRFAIEHPQC